MDWKRFKLQGEYQKRVLGDQKTSKTKDVDSITQIAL